MALKQQIITIQTIIGKLKISKDDKEEMVYNFTNGRSVSVGDMTDNEAEELKQVLHQMQTGKWKAVVPLNDQANQMRRKIISKYREMNYQTWDADKEKMVADMNKIQAHLNEHWKKKLNDYTNTELAEIISVLDRKWLPWFYKNKK